MSGGSDAVLDELRVILADVTGRAELRQAPADAALLGSGLAVGSLAGTLLLRRIRQRFGVDVAAEDLNLDALASLGTLAAYVAARMPAPSGG